MPFFASPVDSTQLFYRYYVPDGIAFKPAADRAVSSSTVTLVFLHGWPMSSRMYEHLMVPLCETYRIPCVAPDRRGFGKSEWNNGPASPPVTFDTFVADNVALLKHLDVKDLVFVGASMGCGEALLTYLASEFVKERCKGFIWMSPNLPYPIQTPACPIAPTVESVDQVLQAIRDSRAATVSVSLPGIFATHVLAGDLPQKTLEMFERVVDDADLVAFEKTALILRRELAEELERFVAGCCGDQNQNQNQKILPVLHLHGDSDAAMPVEAGPREIRRMVPWVDQRVYENAGHGLFLTHAKHVIEDIVRFVDDITAARTSS